MTDFSTRTYKIQNRLVLEYASDLSEMQITFKRKYKYLILYTFAFRLDFSIVCRPKVFLVFFKICYYLLILLSKW